MRKTHLILCALILGLPAMTVNLSATEVTLRLVDQHGDPIPASRFYVQAAGAWVDQNGVVTLAESTYAISVYPGVNGAQQTDWLKRSDTAGVAGATQTIEFVWPMATLALDVVDQYGVSIPVSEGVVYHATGLVSLPFGVVLPVTEDPAEPGIKGWYGTGYRIGLYPGLNGNPSRGTAGGPWLMRDEFNNELTVEGATLDFIWPTATLALDVVDQYGVSIPVSEGIVYHATGLVSLPFGVVLPVTEDPAEPGIKGWYGTGYRIGLYPGLNGNPSRGTAGGPWLMRDEFDNELALAGATLDFIWPTETLALDVVDQYGVSIPASQGIIYHATGGVSLPFGVVLPVTEDPAEPGISGWDKSGYSISVYPGISGSSQSVLYRRENHELAVGNDDLDVEWLQRECAVALVDGNENTIPGSSVSIGYAGSYDNGEVVLLPTTDEALYPTMSGTLVNGYAITLRPSGTSVGTAVFEVTGALEFDPLFVAFDGNQYGLRCIPPVGSVVGQVVADCPEPNTGLHGLSVDAYELGSGDLVGNAVTDDYGHFRIDSLTSTAHAITIVTPLSYNALEDEIVVTVVGGDSVAADFSLACLDITSDPRAIGFWKHQVGVALGGKGSAQIDAATLCDYLDLIEAHFNDNEINQVEVYDPPASDVCTDKLLVAKDLLNLEGNVGLTARAKQQLMALLLNVAGGKLAQTEIISADGATVSQAITYSDWLIDDPSGDHETAKDICAFINDGLVVPSGMIPLSIDHIAYKEASGSPPVPTEFSLNQNYPNPFNAGTIIRYTLSEESAVRLEVFNILGRRVATLINEMQPAGIHEVEWDGRVEGKQPAASGMYFYRVTVGKIVESRKMVLLK